MHASDRKLIRSSAIAVAAVALVSAILAGLDRLGILLASHAEMLLGLALAGALVTAFRARTTQVPVFFTVNRALPAAVNGTAAGGQLIGFSLVGLLGVLYAEPYGGLGLPVGWAAGFVLSAALIAPYLRRAGACTLSEFLSERFDSPATQLVATALGMAVSWLFLVAHLDALGMIGAGVFAMRESAAIYTGAVIVLLSAVLGGSRSAIWFQLTLTAVALIAFLVPVTALSIDRFGWPVPQLSYGQLFEDIAVLRRDMALQGLAAPADAAAPAPGLDTASFIAFTLSAMAGAAALPSIAQRAFCAANTEAARVACGWGLGVVSVLALTAPAYAVIVKTELYQSLIGASVTELPDWVLRYSRLGFMDICGKPVGDAAAAAAACAGSENEAGVLRLADVRVDGEIMLLLFARLSELGPTLTGLIGAGAVAALLVAASGGLVALCHSLSHDIVHRYIVPRATTAGRLVTSRLIMIVTALLAAEYASGQGVSAAKLVCWSLSLAGATLFAPLVLSIWWGRCSRGGALWGMITGAFVTVAYIYFTEFENAPLLFGVGNAAAGAFGVGASLAGTWLASLMTDPPGRRTREFVEAVRTPVGEPIADERHRRAQQARARTSPGE